MSGKEQSSTLVDGIKRYNWTNIVQSVATSLESLFGRCHLCGDRIRCGRLCPGCYDDLPWRCRPWTKNLPSIESVDVCFDFAYPLRQLIHRMKYGGDLAVARMLGDIAAQHFVSPATVPGSTTVIFPVPLSRGRFAQRGFNQAVELALPVSGRLGIDIDEVSIHKPHGLRPQSRLDARLRQKNARGAFAAKRDVAVGTAIVFDDVITTGATASAMGNILLEAGADRVIVWALAAA